MKNNFAQALTIVVLVLTSVHNTYSQMDSLFSISGTADVYFRSNLNSTNNPENGGMLAPGTSFANLPGFALGMANVIGTYESEKVGFVTDLVFGPRGAEAVFGSGPSQNIVNQLYGYIHLSDKVKVTLGNFNTFLGYEVISPAANFNYSTSYMFSYGPFSHTGFKVDFDLGSGFSAMGGIFNPTDATDFNPAGDYFYGGQVGYTNDIGGVWVNLLTDGDFVQIDVTTGWSATEKLYLGLNATMASDNFDGIAGYIQYATSESLSIGVRAEYFKDKGVGVILDDDTDSQSVTDITFSANYKVGNVTIIPEFRLDSFSQENKVVTDAITGDTANSLSSFVLAAVFSF
jgi:hypothetical protein